MKPKTIVSVLDSLSPAKDVALTRALSLADWYESANEAIALAASGWGADLVVLGLPRRSRMEEFVAGSTVHRVLRRTTSPVLLVPGPSRPRRVTSHVEHDDVWAPYTSAPGLVASGEAATGSWGRASWS